MALSANRQVERLVDQELREYPVGASVHIYTGALVGRDPAGHLKAFEPGDTFVGVAYEEADNSAGAAAAIDCRVFVLGDFNHTLTSVAITHEGRAVYATADNTITTRSMGINPARFNSSQLCHRIFLMEAVNTKDMDSTPLLGVFFNVFCVFFVHP